MNKIKLDLEEKEILSEPVETHSGEEVTHLGDLVVLVDNNKGKKICLVILNHSLIWDKEDKDKEKDKIFILI